MRWLVVAVVALAACKGRVPSASEVGSAIAPSNPAPALSVRVHCAPAQLPPRPALAGSMPTEPAAGAGAAVPPPLPAEPPKEHASAVATHSTSSHRPSPRPPADDIADVDAHIADTRAWTPYAAGAGLAPDDIAAVAAKELEPLLAGRAAQLAACFGEHTGSARALVRVAFDGGVISARTGGLGERDAETCLAGQLVGLKVSAPPIVAEVACDLDRGEPQPWRVTREAGYDVLEVDDHGISHGGQPARMGTSAHDAQTSFLVIAPGALPAIKLDAVTPFTIDSAAVLFAAQLDAGAPVYLGMGLDGRLMYRGEDPVDAEALTLAVDPTGAPARACANGHVLAEASLDPKQLDTLFAAVAKHCVAATCSHTFAIAPYGTAKDLAAVAAAGFRANHAKFVIGSDARCASGALGSAR